MKNISKYIDHTLLKQQASEQEVIAICDEAIKYDFMSVCINPCHVKLVSKKLSGTDVKTCTVIGFPLGANTTDVKVFEAVNAIKEGATEIDMVINVGKVKSNDYDFVENDIAQVVNACKQQNQNTIVKVIIETCLLTDSEKEKVCTLLLNTKADFVKTSTGFSTGGATISDVTLMKKIVGDNMQIKASGGVRSTEDFHAFIKAGANRIGTSNGVAILENGVIEKDKY